MAERLVYPKWLEADENVLAERIADLEEDLYATNDDFKAMLDEKRTLLKTSPALHAVFDGGKPSALDAVEVENLTRIIDLENRMRNITDLSIFLFGRKNAYMFMKSIGIG
ncbi:MAG: hypothetical protein PHY23_00425 [Oscillospiraceae bacterium]|nr:hypothetical protein [Oscillospiraceae bacterium]